MNISFLLCLFWTNILNLVLFTSSFCDVHFIWTLSLSLNACFCPSNSFTLRTPMYEWRCLPGGSLRMPRVSYRGDMQSTRYKHCHFSPQNGMKITPLRLLLLPSGIFTYFRACKGLHLLCCIYNANQMLHYIIETICIHTPSIVYTYIFNHLISFKHTCTCIWMAPCIS